MTKAIVSLSGGMDSATLLGDAIRSEREVLAVGFTYGSKHNQYENKAAVDLAAHYRVRYQLIDLSSIIGNHFKSDLLKNGGDVPEGHYESASMSRTVVPGRNMIFASILAGLAWSNNCSEVWMGIHAGDHAIYPDCRPNFYLAMRQAIEYGTDQKVTLMAPYLTINKAAILRTGLQMGVPYRLTRTCYKDQVIACGMCGSCQERLEAFELNKTPDPIAYESRAILPKVPTV